MTDVILFMGRPGTLKSYLASRIASRAGYVYLPTAAAGPIPADADRSEARRERYSRLAGMVEGLVEQGARVVVDGGFLDPASRRDLVEVLHRDRVAVVHCTATETDALARLRRRSADPLDHESTSAASILADGVDAHDDTPGSADVAAGLVGAALEVDTSERMVAWHGRPQDDVAEYLPRIVLELLAEHADGAIGLRTGRTRHHFDDLADRYDATTQWRQHPELLDALHRPVAVGARVLDVGAGTGLAGERYLGDGAIVVSLDPSAGMLRRARERTTIPVIGFAEDLPFLEDTFDLVVVRQVLHYAEPAAALAEVARVLVPGGRVCVAQTVSRSAAASELWSQLTQYTQPLRERVLTSDDVDAWLRAAGLVPEPAQTMTVPRSDTAEGYARRGERPPGGWSAFLDEFARRAADLDPELEFRVDGDRVTYAQSWSIAWATKG